MGGVRLAWWAAAESERGWQKRLPAVRTCCCTNVALLLSDMVTMAGFRAVFETALHVTDRDPASSAMDGLHHR